MNTKKYFLFSLYTFLIISYILLCVVIIIIRTNCFSSDLLKVREESIKNDESIIMTMTKVKNHEYYSQNNVEDLRSIDLSIDVSEIDSSIERVFNACEKYSIVTELQPKHFLHSPKHNVLFCWIRKVASKSFTKFFADLEDVQILRDSYDREVDSFDLENNEDLINLIGDREVFKFIAVRHPFERLVASYRDRIEDNSKYTAQAWIYVPKIFHVTRPKLFHFNKSTVPLYEIFDFNRRLKIIPTFKEFIVWLLKQPETMNDVHWSQYYSHCSLCQVQFDYVLKLDHHSTKDINYIFANVGVDTKNWQFPNIGANKKNLTDFNVTCSYLSILSQEMFYKLYERYKIDFEMFDYDYKIYEKCIIT